MHVLDPLEKTSVESDVFTRSVMVGKTTERIVLFFKSAVGMASSEQVLLAHHLMTFSNFFFV